MALKRPKVSGTGGNELHAPNHEHLRPAQTLPRVPNESGPILAARNVTKAFGPVTVLQAVMSIFLRVKSTP
ncbi:MAG: hypothetical protein JO151_15685 [Verrucomicrobia bacterium]|nr:hypothetical protein [Verrucomicrobiota bacterium]